MVQEVLIPSIAQGATAVGEAALEVVANPLKVGTQLAKHYKELQEAAETAGICTDICRSMSATACDRAPILCKLLAVGHVYADSDSRCLGYLSLQEPAAFVWTLGLCAV